MSSSSAHTFLQAFLPPFIAPSYLPASFLPLHSCVSMRGSWGEHVFPSLKQRRVLGSYAGLRPASTQRDYFIRSWPEQHWISVGGIRSTGMYCWMRCTRFSCCLCLPGCYCLNYPSPSAAPAVKCYLNFEITTALASPLTTWTPAHLNICTSKA